MEDARRERLEIDAEGNARPIGSGAIRRMQARQGSYLVMPSPQHLVFMRQLEIAGAPRCVLAGEIGSAGALCDIVSLVGHAAWKGEFLVVDGDSSRSVYFDQGHVIGAQSSSERERLGLVLYRYGLLGEDQVSAAAEASTAGGLRFGEAVVKLGFLTREKLFELMGKQTEEIFYAMLLVGQGMFYFLDSFDEAALSARQKIPVASLIREGVRRMHELKYFRARIPSDRHIPTRVAGKWPPEGDPHGVYAASDGARTVADLCRFLGADEFEVTRAVFQLVHAGHLFVKPPRLDIAETVDVFNRAMALILRELDAMDEGDDVRTQLAEFVAKNPAWAVALEGAGPADDGTLTPAQIEKNLEATTDAQEMLARTLYEYASYALFLARPHIQRNLSRTARGAGESNKRFSRRVAAMLGPITPASGAESSDKPPRR